MFFFFLFWFLEVWGENKILKEITKPNKKQKTKPPNLSTGRSCTRIPQMWSDSGRLQKEPSRLPWISEAHKEFLLSSLENSDNPIYLESQRHGFSSKGTFQGLQPGTSPSSKSWREIILNFQKAIMGLKYQQLTLLLSGMTSQHLHDFLTFLSTQCNCPFL